ncbi:HAD-IC family P-type ATPase [Candidatus Uhrbacteria bacterium]|nr:HAD-IC family P-type ATPase [Candidatus Uhrbacteria bacterium]
MTQWHTLGRADTLAKLATAREGLTDAESARRLLAHGKNTLPQKKSPSLFFLFFRQFVNPLIAVLVIAAIITAFLHEIADTIVIGVAVLLNVIIGFVQESKAERALLALLHIVDDAATVVRSGRHMRIPREAVVPGDIVALRSGDRIPADLRLLDAYDCEVNEAILTGESLPQAKTTARTEDHRRLGERTNMAYAGTVVTRGNALGVVVATGLTTEVGKIAKSLDEHHGERTPLQEKLARFSNQFSFVVVAVALAVFLLGIVTGRSFIEMFTIAVALAVAAIPEGLVVGVTAILAVGMHRLVREKAIVRRLLAAEILGSTTVICTDKTGTLTEGDMRLLRVVTLDHESDCGKAEALPADARHALSIGVLVNESVVEERDGEVHVFGSPTERGIALGAFAFGIRKSVLSHHERILDALPFNSERKMAAVLTEGARGRMLSILGAPDRLLPLATHAMRGGARVPMAKSVHTELVEKLRLLAEHGWRVLAVAERTFPHDVARIALVPDAMSDCTMVGFLVLADPLRNGVGEMIRRAKEAGIATVMITGDHRSTATHIAKELGLPHEAQNIMEGESLERLSPEVLAKRVLDVHVYARVVPSEKVAIVEAWQARGAVVAMTGDGVNDAPALQRADIGVAVGTATDVAKEVADLVILDNNFATIVRAVEEGRVIMDNVRKLILYLLSDSFSEIILIAGGLLLGWPLPLSAVQILWINLVTDGFPNLALTVDPGEREAMREKPIPRNAPLLDRERVILIALVSLFTGLANLALFYYVWRTTHDIDHARRVVFTALGFDSLLYVFSCRSLRRPIWRSSFFSNPALVLAVGAGMLVQLAALYVPFLQKLLGLSPLTMQEYGIIILLSFAVIVLIEGVKGIFFWNNQRSRTV